MVKSWTFDPPLVKDTMATGATSTNRWGVSYRKLEVFPPRASGPPGCRPRVDCSNQETRDVEGGVFGGSACRWEYTAPLFGGRRSVGATQG